MCSSREEEMKMEFLYSTVWSGGLILRLLAEVNSLCAALVAAPQKETNSGKDVAGCMLSPLHLR